jgi:HEAT repeat protein
VARAAKPTVDDELEQLDELTGERAHIVATLQRALSANHCRIVARAARLAEEGLLYELVPALQKAYDGFLDKPLKRDPSSLAKKAIARALVALDCDDAEFFRRGLAYRQLEPVWGGTTDTAADVRASCAMGLVACGHSRALVELTGLLQDPEAAARIGAVRAIACGNPREAELLLRSKVLAGDAEPQVLGECFTGLLSVEPDESISFVAAYLEHSDDAVRELAALALGDSGLDGALAPLKDAWSRVLVSENFRRAIVQAAAAHRSEAAFDWLLAIVEESRVPVALTAIEALALYRHNTRLMQRLKSALVERGDQVLLEHVAALAV